MSHFSKTRAFLLSAVAVTALSIPAPAQAGFEWRGPLVPPAPPPSHTAPAPQHHTDSDMDGLAPVIVWDGAVPAMPAVKPTPVDSAPMGAASAAQPQEDGGTVVEGFGANLPLVIAVQQIAPPGFRVSFAPGVNPGEQVSWQGGRPWKHVLSDTLGAVGLTSKIEDGTLVIMDKTMVPPATQHAAQSLDDGMTPMPPLTSAEAEPAPAAPIALSPEPPSDDGRVLVGRASETGTKLERAVPPVEATPEEKTVSIRRQKPKKKSFLESLGLFNSEDDAKEVEAPAAEEAKPAVSVTNAAALPVMDAPAESPPPDDALAPPVSLTDAPEAETQASVGMEMSPAAKAFAEESMAVAPAWRAHEGETLRSVLGDWSRTAGVEMYWSVDYDYKLESDMDFSGTYDEAVDKILKKFSSARPQPYGKLHQGSDGPRVLVIKVYDSAG